MKGWPFGICLLLSKARIVSKLPLHSEREDLVEIISKRRNNQFDISSLDSCNQESSYTEDPLDDGMRPRQYHAIAPPPLPTIQ